VTDAEDQIVRIATLLRTLRPDQVERVETFANVLAEPAICTYSSDVVTEAIARQFNDALRFHHHASAEPFRKEKFEYAIVKSLGRAGREARMAPTGNPGHDLTVDGERWSLKSQADVGVRREVIWISKFMELGRGAWELALLRDQFLSHLEGYDRIFTLRCFRNTVENGADFEYELVEIPKDLLLLATGGVLESRESSRQNPKPGYCTVRDAAGSVLFRLYFDGGSERKLQIKDLVKTRCIVHATWKITFPI
jgi:hypothetical protein